jgi:hypothetical protein
VISHWSIARTRGEGVHVAVNHETPEIVVDFRKARGGSTIRFSGDELGVLTGEMK